MDLEILKRAGKRYARVFVFGVIAYLATTLPTVPIVEWTDWKRLLPAVVFAGVTAGITALDKVLRDSQTSP